MHTVSHFIESNNPNPLRSLSIGLPDDPHAEMETADARRATLEAKAMLQDADIQHCASCGMESSGNVLAGVTVPLCDRCLCEHAVTAIGLPLARSIVTEVEQAEGDLWLEVTSYRQNCGA